MRDLFNLLARHWLRFVNMDRAPAPALPPAILNDEEFTHDPLISKSDILFRG